MYFSIAHIFEKELSLENRSYWVDYAKAIGILLVVYGHVIHGIYKANITLPKKFYELSYSVVYSFHMPLFFFLSGMFFYRSLLKQGGIKLTIRKIDTIVYPYIIWSIIQGLTEIFLSSYTNGDSSYFEVFSLLWSPRQQFWFLYTLFFIFLLATTFFSLVPKKAAIPVFLLSILAYIYPTVMPSGFIFNYISFNLVFFTFGIVFSLYFKAEQFSNTLTLFFLTCTFIISQYYFHHTLSLTSSDKGIESLLLAFISIIFIVSLSARASLTPNKLFIFIGTSSMAIFVMHILAGSGIRIFLHTLLGIDSFSIHLLAGCIIGIFAPLLAVITINKLKIPYVFSAPVSKHIMFSYKNILVKKNN